MASPSASGWSPPSSAGSPRCRPSASSAGPWTRTRSAWWIEPGSCRRALPSRRCTWRALDELELELALIEALGDTRRVRPIAARRFGTGARTLACADGDVPLRAVADVLLDTVEGAPEPRSIPARARPDGPSLERWVRRVAVTAGLDIEVRIEPSLVANAAAGDRVVFLADRVFGEREARRLALHEVAGHLVAAANGRQQPLRLFALGTAGSFADQEGMCIWLEEAAGLLDGDRVRTLAGRVVATDAMHDGASFAETVRLLTREHGFGAAAAVSLAERAHRGGGVARDTAYLYGWLRVRSALGQGLVALDELRSGKVGLADVSRLRRLRELGLARPATYRPSLARSLGATDFGTSLDTSPPSFVTSLQRFEAT